MPVFIELSPDCFQLAPGIKVLKAEEYSRYLEAGKIVEAAQNQYQRMIKDAESIYQCEKQRGYEEGINQAKVEQASEIMATLAHCRQRLKSLEPQLAQLVMETVSKVIGQFDNQELTRKLIEQALHQNKCSRAILRVHPDNAQVLKCQLAEIKQRYSDMEYLEVQKDSMVEEAGCILETDLGNIQATLSSQLAALEHAASRL
ncbi:HrpE/YscL family type III secretion apparatus protein [Endozoicomonas sp. Mp262]|uniref:HrpE/YscL family type III secretion apparatus protein n=1 Tax=Endozoicomonas sp. Mp262 TaxID=2919499 RepID=UPI0021DA47BF